MFPAYKHPFLEALSPSVCTCGDISCILSYHTYEAIGHDFYLLGNR